jgi:hypothetical protein
MIDRNLWHASLTDEVILAAVERRNTSLDNPGFCLICGAEAEGVEPDARNYQCESCGADQVFGAEELMMVIAI